MKKTLAAFLFIVVVITVVYAVVGWFRLERMRSEASASFQTLVDFYVSMDKEHVAKLETVASLQDSDRSVIAQYRAALVSAADSRPLAQRIESLRTAQGIGFSLFGTASGALVQAADYETWRTGSSDSGMAFPMILQYNQAAKGLNDEMTLWPGNMFAWFFHYQPLVLIDVNGKPFEQRPSRI